jgi:hypothetical protein
VVIRAVLVNKRLDYVVLVITVLAAVQLVAHVLRDTAVLVPKRLQFAPMALIHPSELHRAQFAPLDSHALRPTSRPVHVHLELIASEVPLYAHSVLQQHMPMRLLRLVAIHVH